MIYNVNFCKKCGWYICGDSGFLIEKAHADTGCGNSDLIYEYFIPSLTTSDFNGCYKIYKTLNGKLQDGDTTIKDREGYDKVMAWIEKIETKVI